MMTFGQFRQNKTIQRILGTCDRDELKAYCNEGVERLITRGKWKGTYQRIRVCSDSGCITFPRQVAAIYEMAVCGQPVSVRNQLWEFLSNGPGLDWEATEGSCSCPGPNFIERGWFPLFSDIRSPNKRIRVYCNQQSDYGKEVLFQGYDDSNNIIRTEHNGAIVEGFYLTLADPFVESEFDVKSITGVQKPVTDGDLLVYEVDTSGNQRQLAIFQPDELIPSYRRYFMNNPSGLCTTGCCNEVNTFTGFAKLEYIPVSSDTDYILIDNFPALKEICQSIRMAEKDAPNAMGQAEIYEKRAIRELNNQKQNYNSNDTIAVGMRVYGSADLRRKRIGRLM